MLGSVVFCTGAGVSPSEEDPPEGFPDSGIHGFGDVSDGFYGVSGGYRKSL